MLRVRAWCGIPPAELKRISNVFMRAPRALFECEGTGLSVHRPRDWRKTADKFRPKRRASGTGNTVDARTPSACGRSRV